jgi:cytochrome c oxidase cbb3-type subunit 1
MHPFYAMRAIGGMFFLTGMVLMAINIYMTVRRGMREADSAQARAAVAAV